MHSLPDDRTARARIRDEALRLFGARGAAGVTVRDIAAAAGVSPALVVRHYGSKDGLRDAVDDHVLRVFGAMLAPVVAPAGFDPAALPSLAELVSTHLPADSAVPAYLGRMLLDGGDAGTALFERLHELSRQALDGLVGTGQATSGADPAVRAAFLLVNDLAVLILRSRLAEVLGIDPLSPTGMRRWGAEVLAIYGGGLGATLPDGTSAKDTGRGGRP